MAEHNSDKQLAQTLLALAMDLMSASSPIPASRLINRHFPGISSEAARKKLSRARETLASCGLIVAQTQTEDGTAWSVDPSCYPEGALEPNDASIVQLLTSPLLRDGSFPHRTNLRYALLKLGSAPAGRAGEAPLLDDHVLETVRACLGNHLMLELDYEDAHGQLSHRLVAPLGLFDFRDYTYLVCSASGPKDGDGIRTLRCDRMSHCRKTRKSFTPPADFDVNEYRLLPFQMGPTIARCTFSVPEGTAASLIETTLGKGRLYKSGNQLLWEVDVSSFDDAAAWAIAHGLSPEAPAELVGRCHGLLRGCLA